MRLIASATSTCHRQYSLGVPFIERFFDLAQAAQNGRGAGYIGMITANSFMKREFGKKLIEEFFPRVDLTHVIDTSGAYIPGHGTPTVILFGRNRNPVGDEVRAVLGIRGEPSTPEEPALGKVWRSIVEHLDNGGAQNEFVSVTNMPRETFARHPWSIGGGGAAELKQIIEEASSTTLGLVVESIGRTTVVGEDDCWILDSSTAYRLKVDRIRCLQFGIGGCIRDWSLFEIPLVIYPYVEIGGKSINLGSYVVTHHLWLFRTLLRQRTVFGKSLIEQGRPWFEHLEHYVSKLQTPLSIAFAFVATHNHFVLDRGGKVFNRSAPIIKLPSNATEDDHLALLGLLNSSTACFWMKQVSHNKGATSDKGVLQSDPEKFRYEFDGTKLSRFPIPTLNSEQHEAIVKLAQCLDQMARQLSESTFKHYIYWLAVLGQSSRIFGEYLRGPRRYKGQMIAGRRSLTGSAMSSTGLPIERPAIQRLLPQLKLVSAPSRSSWPANGGCERRPPGHTRIARRHHSDSHTTGRTTIARSLSVDRPDRVRPQHWPNRATRVQTPLEYRPWDQKLTAGLADWLLDRLESAHYWPDPAQTPELTSCTRLAERAARDTDFLQVAALYRGREDFDVLALVSELVASEAVPFLPVLRYKPSGLTKRAVWERTWELQRREDAGEAVGSIPVPPKYAAADFKSADIWRLRGKLDVPKERFISYPCAERDSDRALVVGWAGWNHLQQAMALAAYYDRMKHREGWAPERLVPLLAGLDQLVPWLLQWHNDVDPDLQLRLGEFYRDFVRDEAQSLGYTVEQLRAWQPPHVTRSHRRK